ncbi:MAG: MBL fold metallo-hydrolase [Lentisphaerae bacterium]|nr:MBL fold metallo-hydrolase [Lentisphaerota bacterium]
MRPSPAHAADDAPVRITILVDNTVNRPGLRAEHGWAVWIDAGDTTLLVDTGQSDLVIANATALGLRFDALDAVVLSHGHYDHTGGLAAVLERARDGVRVYAHPAALRPKVRCTPAGSRPIGIPAEGLAALHRPGVDLRLIETPTDIAPGLWLTGPIPRRHAEEVPEPGFCLDPAGQIPDPLDDDLALCLETPAGRVVILGCAHRGVVATLDQSAALRPTTRLQAVMGGMHLRSATAATLQWSVEALKHSGYERLVPAHCTGLPAIAALWAACPGRCGEAGVGTTLSF